MSQMPSAYTHLPVQYRRAYNIALKIEFTVVSPTYRAILRLKIKLLGPSGSHLQISLWCCVSFDLRVAQLAGSFQLLYQFQYQKLIFGEREFQD